jgi:hypothetical protein
MLSEAAEAKKRGAIISAGLLPPAAVALQDCFRSSGQARRNPLLQRASAAHLLAIFLTVPGMHYSSLKWFPYNMQGETIWQRTRAIRMSVGTMTCGKCNKELVHSTLTKPDGTTVHVSQCPDGHGKIKSPMCCGQDGCRSEQNVNRIPRRSTDGAWRARPP